MAGYTGTDRERLALRSFVRLLRTASSISAAVHEGLAEHHLTES